MINRVCDTQTHQIAARKEKQMESLEAALVIKNKENVRTRWNLKPSEQEKQLTCRAETTVGKTKRRQD